MNIFVDYRTYYFAKTLDFYTLIIYTIVTVINRFL